MVEITLFTTASIDPATDVALSAVITDAVGTGALGPVARLHRTEPALAFGRADRNVPGYRRAVEIARAHRYTPIERLAGGRAAVFHHGTWSFSLAMPTPDPRTGILERFTLITDITVEALRSLGVDAGVGEVPGEYCPGAYSVHAAGRVKLAGFGQRLHRHSAHVGGVLVVHDSPAVNAVLVPVYAALGLTMDPQVTGAVDDEVATDMDGVGEALKTALAQRFTVTPGEVPAALLDLAAERADAHRP